LVFKGLDFPGFESPSSLAHLWMSWRRKDVQGKWLALFYAAAWTIWLEQGSFSFHGVVGISFSSWQPRVKAKDKAFPYSASNSQMLQSSSWLCSVWLVDSVF